MISKAEIKKIKKLHLKTSLMVDNMMAGQYRSVFRGCGMEFEEVREYRPGDEVRAIDWKVSARLGKTYVKVFREEREACVVLLVDMSSSNLFGSTGMTKMEKAAEVAALVSYVAIKNNDRAGLILFTDKVELYIPPGKGPSHVWRIIRAVYTFNSGKGAKTDIKKALDFFAKVAPIKSLCFLISDFNSPPFEKEIKMLKPRHEIIAVKIGDKNDFYLPSDGIVSFRDPETGREFLFDSGFKDSREKWLDKAQAYKNGISLFFKKCGIDLLELNTDDSSGDMLVKYFRYRHLRVQKSNG
ncbi:MAG: DUF58 domain-containing protein [Deltaproteobacteria bacterium]|nr:MAG: DUF58 domain-containing protein [Deltaproteobacteria bacterium]